MQSVRARFLFVLVAAASLSCGCTDQKLTTFRNDRLLEEYRYALGEDYVEAGGVRFCYQDVGSGPVLLIIPGLGTSVDFWQLSVPALAEHYRVVAVDLPGFAKSSKPDASYELQWIADRIIDFLNALHIEKASVMGGSMGGHLALLLALEHPQRFERVVMMGSTGAWKPPNAALNAVLRVLWNEWLVTDYLRGHWPRLFELMFQREHAEMQPVFSYQMAVRAVGDRFAPEGRASARALRSIFYTSLRDRLGEVRQPVLLIWGEHDQIHPPNEDVQYLRKNLPDARLVIVPDAGHEVMVDHPQVFNKLVIEFLQGGTAAVRDQW